VESGDACFIYSLNPTGPKVFGVSIDQLVERQGAAIPEVVYQSVKCIEKGTQPTIINTVLYITIIRD
jgi:hypothetical protein